MMMMMMMIIDDFDKHSSFSYKNPSISALLIIYSCARKTVGTLWHTMYIHTTRLKESREICERWS